MLASRTISSAATPRREPLPRFFLMIFAAYSVPVLFSAHFLTTANCPLKPKFKALFRKELFNILFDFVYLMYMELLRLEKKYPTFLSHLRYRRSSQSCPF